MNKSQLVNEMAQISGLTKKDSALALDAFMSAVTSALEKGEKVQLVGFGNFETVQRAEKNGRNPRTQEPIVIKATKTVRFKTGKNLKKIVNK